MYKGLTKLDVVGWLKWNGHFSLAAYLANQPVKEIKRCAELAANQAKAQLKSEKSP